MNWIAQIGIGSLIALALSGPAFSHANYATSSPSANATLRESPKEVSIVVSQQLEGAFSRIEVTDAKGVRVDKKNSRVTDGRTRLIVDVTPLPPGTYTVRWFAASVDTHRTSGTFKFKVAR